MGSLARAVGPASSRHGWIVVSSSRPATPPPQGHPSNPFCRVLENSHKPLPSRRVRSFVQLPGTHPYYFPECASLVSLTRAWILLRLGGAARRGPRTNVTGHGAESKGRAEGKKGHHSSYRRAAGEHHGIYAKCDRPATAVVRGTATFWKLVWTLPRPRQGFQFPISKGPCRRPLCLSILFGAPSEGPSIAAKPGDHAPMDLGPGIV